MDQLSAQDSQFLYLETENNYTHVTYVAVYDPATSEIARFSFDAILELVQSRLHVSPIFQRKLKRVPLDLDYPYWMDDEYFDYESHVIYTRLPEPGTWSQFKRHIARYHSRPLDMNRPLWEMYVVEGLDAIDAYPPGAFAVATKVHHAAVDGAAAMRFFVALSDVDAKGTPATSLDRPAQFSGDGPNLLGMASRALVSHVTSPLRIANSMWHIAPILAPALARRLSNRPDRDGFPVPKTRFNSKIIPQKIFDATTFKLEDFKVIRKAVPAAKINDVVLAICSGAVKSYLDSRDELPEQSLIAFVPVNARDRNSDSEIGPGNRLTAMTTPLHTDVDDPVQRLRAITRSTQDSKAARSGLSARIMTDLTQHIPGSTMALASRFMVEGGVSSMANLYVSNVPGPQVPLYLAGCQMIAQFGLAPIGDGAGLFIGVGSYNGQISFAFTSTRDIIPDPERFIDCFEASFHELVDGSRKVTAGNRKRSTSKKRRKKVLRKPKSAQGKTS